MRLTALILTCLLPVAALAGPKEAVLADIVDNHVLPRFDSLADHSAALDAAAVQNCDTESSGLRRAFAEAFDDWVAVSHLRFGPTETDNRAFALAYWPDSRGATPKTLSGLIAGADPVVDDPADFATVSIAGRGFYALEHLLYDPAYAGIAPEGYACRLVRAMTRDIAATTAAIAADWRGSHADQMRHPGADSAYRSEDEALRAFYTALDAGLEFTADVRIGRPLGSFERPRPNRAEARRSGRSLRHVQLSVAALHDLALRLGALATPQDMARAEDAFRRAAGAADTLDDPVFAGVSGPADRFRVEVLQQRIDDARRLSREVIAPSLGIAAGFNSQDGD